MSGIHCESTLKYVHVSLNLNIKEVVVDKATGRQTQKENLLLFWANRYSMAAQYTKFDLLQPNFMEFCLHFQVTNGQQKKLSAIDTVVVDASPSYRYVLNSPKYLFCSSGLIKYFPETNSGVPWILDDKKIIPAWENFEVNCPPDLRQYIRKVVDLKKKLQLAEEQIDEPDQEQNTDLFQLQW